MSESQTPEQPQPAATPAKKPQDKVTQGCLGCFGLIVLCALIGWIADLGGCNKPEENPAKKLMKNAAGPSNPIAQKIQSLNTGNAYGVGYKDGILEFANLGQTFSQMPGDMMDQLNNAYQLKNSFFDLMATQNAFDPTVFSEYRRGWNAGWNNHGVSH